LIHFYKRAIGIIILEKMQKNSLNVPGFHKSRSSSCMADKLERSGSFKLRRQSSVKSLASLMSHRKKRDSDAVSYSESQKSYSDELKDKFQEMGGFRRRLTRRMSSIMDFSKKSQVDARRHSESTLNFENKVKFTISGSDECDGTGENEKDPVRQLQRKDLPICWQDETQVKQTRRVEVSASEDLMTQLHQRAYTRHLARHVMSYLGEEEFVSMYQVSALWSKMLSKDLPHLLLKRILKPNGS